MTTWRMQALLRFARRLCRTENTIAMGGVQKASLPEKRRYSATRVYRAITAAVRAAASVCVGTINLGALGALGRPQ
eukprot:CAMPEP_0205912822 /NCGR_PEP_ID=MMETSP1325-20131115/6107_1 /ASSEMBLY_ACC=CAM_ASM_000708 /TAXON_ID=236786 /ORGANISM="Florenciella sp., Strain RCC1007" /LENGTH=75 /DNA_ID=CAMNT_0053279585 /DNA_START=65 /DNA_END=291 /DNA_ORIENTATION=+